MKHLKFVSILFLVITILISCSEKGDNTISEHTHDCDFVQNDDDMDGLFDETELMIVRACRENLLMSKSDIEVNLMGEWELTGFAAGWFPAVSKPCGFIKITEDELTFKFNNGQVDIDSTLQWEIEELDWNGTPSFRLSLHPEYYLILNQFCENYMFVDDTPVDGNMFLYTKIN